MDKKATMQCCLSGAWGGLEMVAYETAVKMHENGHLVTTVCPPGSPLQAKLAEAGLPTIELVRKHRYFAPKVLLELRRQLRSGKFSAVLVQQTNDLWQVVPALLGLPEIRLVAVSHMLVPGSKRDLRHSLLYRRLNHLVASTEIHKKNLIEQLPIRPETITVLPCSVDTQKFNPRKRSEAIRQQYLKSPGELLVGVVSRLDKKKGLLETVQAAEKLRGWNVKFQIVFFGQETIDEPGMKAILEAEIQRRKLTGHVQLVGHRTDIDAVIASLDVLLLPSPAETFGRVLIEAMASGVAIVASCGGGVSDIVRHNVDGLLVQPLHVQEMAEALQLCSSDPQKRQQIAQAGIARAHEVFDYRKVDSRLYALLGVSQKR